MCEQAVCLGCARRRAKKPRTYCPVCKHRLAHGWQTLDRDDIPDSNAEHRRVAQAFRRYAKNRA